jgi:hypothetical protein
LLIDEEGLANHRGEFVNIRAQSKIINRQGIINQKSPITNRSEALRPSQGAP